jgi:hypothetical protein
MIGGMVSSTIPTLLVIPAVCTGQGSRGAACGGALRSNRSIYINAFEARMSVSDCADLASVDEILKRWRNISPQAARR